MRRLAEKRGLILLTDPDGAGFVIRNHLKGAIPRQQLKQAGEEIRQEKAQAQQTMKRAAQQRMDEADKQAQAILATAREAAERYHDKAVQDTQKDLQELAVTAAEKLVLQSDGDALDQFLNAAERGSGHEHTEQ